MKVSVVSHSLGHETRVVAGALTADHLHQVAEAFIRDTTPGPLGNALIKVFGRWRFRSYVIDFSGRTRAHITFSMRVKPDLMFFKGGPIAVAYGHAAKFEVFVDSHEALPLEKADKTAHPYDAGVP
jgi:hypothetical protein